MLKKLSYMGMALIASSGIAFADTSEMSSTTDSTSTSVSTDAGATDATTTTQVSHKHHKKHTAKHKQHKHHNADMASAVDAVVPAGGYKGEVAAAPCPACVHAAFNTGPYLGLSASSRVNYLSHPAAFHGVEGTVFAGYSTAWDQMYGAVEIFAQKAASIANYRTTAGSTASSWGYGLSVLPGYMVTENVLGYLRLGVVKSRFTTGNSNLTGGQVGLGMETALSNNWDLRGEWVHSFYKAMRLGNPKSQQFNLGLLYKFQA